MMLGPLQNSRFKKRGGRAFHAGDIEAAGGGGKSSNQRAESGDLLGTRQERGIRGGREKLDREGGVCRVAIGVEQGARANEIMGQKIIVTDITIDRLGLSRKFKRATIRTADLKRAAIEMIECQRRQRLRKKQMSDGRHAATAEKHVRSSSI